MRISRVGKAGIEAMTKKGSNARFSGGTASSLSVNADKGTVRSRAIGSHNGPWRSKPIQRISLNTDTGSKFTHTSINRKHAAAGVGAGVATSGVAFHQQGSRAINKHPITRGY